MADYGSDERHILFPTNVTREVLVKEPVPVDWLQYPGTGCQNPGDFNIIIQGRRLIINITNQDRGEGMGETLVNPFCGIGLSLAFLVASVNYFKQKKYKLASAFLGGSIGLLFTKLAMSVGWLPGGSEGEDFILFAPLLALAGMAGGWLIATIALRGNHL